MKLPAHVIRIDRRAQRVELAVGGVTQTLWATYPNAQRPPAPLSTVNVEQTGSGTWEVRSAGGPAGSELFHDDFNLIIAAAGLGLAGMQADTTWISDDAASGESITQALLAGGSGVMKMTTVAAGGSFVRIGKDTASFDLDATSAYWLSSRSAPDGTGGRRHAIGFFDLLGGVNQATISYDVGASSFDQISDGTNALTTAHQPVTNKWEYRDIVVIPGVCVAGWIDGDGPYVLASGIPGAGTQVTPFAFVSYVSGIFPLGFFVDWMHCEKFTQAIHPDRLYEFSVGGCPV